MIFRNCARQSGLAERKAMIDPEHALAIVRQAEELEISHSTIYYRPRPTSDADLLGWNERVPASASGNRQTPTSSKTNR
jgi:hypothetical protein